MKEQLTVSHRDIDKLKVISNVINGHLTWDQAAEQLTDATGVVPSQIHSP